MIAPISENSLFGRIAGILSAIYFTVTQNYTYYIVYRFFETVASISIVDFLLISEVKEQE